MVSSRPAKYVNEIKFSLKIPGDVYKSIRVFAAHRGVSAQVAMIELLAVAAPLATAKLEAEAKTEGSAK